MRDGSSPGRGNPRRKRSQAHHNERSPRSKAGHSTTSRMSPREPLDDAFYVRLERRRTVDQQDGLIPGRVFQPSSFHVLRGGLAKVRRQPTTPRPQDRKSTRLNSSHLVI